MEVHTGVATLAACQLKCVEALFGCQGFTWVHGEASDGYAPKEPRNPQCGQYNGKRTCNDAPECRWDCSNADALQTPRWPADATCISTVDTASSPSSTGLAHLYRLHADKNILGYDIKEVQVPDAGSCARACDEAWNSACVAFAISGSQCWLKYGINPVKTSSAGTDWYERLTPRVYTCPNGSTCGQSVAGHLYIQRSDNKFDNGNNVLSEGEGGTLKHASSEEVCFKFFEDSTAAAKVAVVYIASLEQCHIMTVALANQAAEDATTEAAGHLWYEPYQPT